MGIIDIIIPVYRGIEHLRSCIDSLRSCQQKNPYEIILINDFSPENAINEYFDCLESNKQGVTLILLRNNKNLGYTASVNRGILLHPDRDVIILNSDTIVANHWLDRLHDCAYGNEKAGTVSPFSNNAAIFSFPDPCVPNNLPDGFSTESLDAIFSDVNSSKSVEAPATDGFCMYIKRACLNEVGPFGVEKCGRGYDEEGDFCFRSAKMGWRHLLCVDTFVYHLGDAGFGKEKTILETSAAVKIGKHHPVYSEKECNFLKRDPALPYRLTAKIEMVRRSPKTKILIVTHAIGGGVEKHVQGLVYKFRNDIDAVVIKPIASIGVVMHLNREQTVQDLFFKLPDDLKDLVSLCRYLRISRVHYHHLIGHDAVVWKLFKYIGVEADFTIHDFFLISGHPLLLEPAINATHGTKFRSDVDIEKWYRKASEFLSSMDRVIAPSEFAADVFRKHYQQLNIIVAFHPDWETDFPYKHPGPVPITNGEKFRIVVIGFLNREKGADVLEKCAISSRRHKIPLMFTLIGSAYRSLHKSVKMTGEYDDQDLDKIIATENPHLIWFPGFCHETYSYTLSAALRSGRPIVVTDRGAFPERVLNRPYTWIRPGEASIKSWLGFFQFLQEASCKPEGQKLWVQNGVNNNSFFYEGGYLKDTTLKNDDCNLELSDDWIRKYAFHNNLMRLSNGRIKLKEKILKLKIRLRLNPIISFLMRHIPYGSQQSAKRCLSVMSRLFRF